jgi:hypothetical protein
MAKTYKIHPAIGIARLGNSRTEWFDGPEVPDLSFTPAPSGAYREANSLIRRQAVKFRIYEYNFAGLDASRPTSVRQITAREADIQWHVHLANLKSFTRDPQVSNRIPAPNDPGVKTVTAGQMLDVIGTVFGASVQLGTLRTDENCLLRVLGGFGRSESPGHPTEQPSGLFNPDWFDDVADGPVRATIRLRDTGEMPAVEAAWVITGVPKYAAPVASIVTLYDVAYDLAVRHFGLAPSPQVSFTRDIFPVLQRAVLMQWVDPDARQGHGPTGPANFLDPTQFDRLRDNGSGARPFRQHVFQQLKNPDGGGGNMPALVGPAPAETPQADGLTLTRLQYDQFRRWSLGDFDADWTGPPSPRPFDQLSPQEQTVALDQASLSTGVGGTFGPGIEVGRHFGERQTFERSFRINTTLAAGFLTSSLSVPWQADYSACGLGWWPGGRPNAVTADGDNFQTWARFTGQDQMINAWWKLGFLAKRTLADGRTAYLETERV